MAVYKLYSNCKYRTETYAAICNLNKLLHYQTMKRRYGFFVGRSKFNLSEQTNLINDDGEMYIAYRYHYSIFSSGYRFVFSLLGISH